MKRNARWAENCICVCICVCGCVRVLAVLKNEWRNRFLHRIFRQKTRISLWVCNVEKNMSHKIEGISQSEFALQTSLGSQKKDRNRVQWTRARVDDVREKRATAYSHWTWIRRMTNLSSTEPLNSFERSSRKMRAVPRNVYSRSD